MARELMILQTASILKREAGIYKKSPINDDCNNYVHFEEITVIPEYLRN